MPSWHSAVLLAKAKQGWAPSRLKQLSSKPGGTDRTNQPADRQTEGGQTNNDEKHSRQVKTKPVHFPRKLCSAQASFRHSKAISLGKLGNLRVTYITRATPDAVRRQSERATKIASGKVGAIRSSDAQSWKGPPVLTHLLHLPTEWLGPTPKMG